MKHINQLLRECLDRIDEKAKKHNDTEAHKRGIAEARRILAESSKAERSAA